MHTEKALEERYQIINEIFGNTVYLRDKNEILIFCPKHYHRKRKLQINIKKNFFHCWVCGYSSKSIFKLLREYANLLQRNRYYETLGIKFKEPEKTKNIFLPSEYKFILNNANTPVGIMSLNFLINSLKVSKKTILQNKIGFCEEGKYSERILFPSFDVGGNVNYYTTRTINDNTKRKYIDCDAQKSDVVYNELFVNWDKPIILVESVKTQLRHFAISNIVPMLGSRLNEDYRLFQNIVLNNVPKVFVALDPDVKIKAYEIMRKLFSYGIETKFVDLDTQPDEITTNEFINKLLESKSYHKDLLLKEKIAKL